MATSLTVDERAKAMQMKKMGLTSEEILQKLRSPQKAAPAKKFSTVMEEEEGPGFFDRVATGFKEGVDRSRESSEQKKQDQYNQLAKIDKMSDPRQKAEAFMAHLREKSSFSSRAEDLSIGVQKAFLPISGAVEGAVEPLTEAVASGASSAEQFMEWATEGPTKGLRYLIGKKNLESINSKVDSKLQAIASDVSAMDPKFKRQLGNYFKAAEGLSVLPVGAGAKAGVQAGAKSIKGATKTVFQQAGKVDAKGMAQFLGNGLLSQAKSGQLMLNKAGEAVFRPLKKGAEMAGPLASGAKGFGQDMIRHGTTTLTKLNPETLDTLKEIPILYRMAKRGDITRESAGEKVAKGVSQRLEDLSFTGKGYDKFRESPGDIVMSKPLADIDQILSKNGLVRGPEGWTAAEKLSTKLTGKDIDTINEAVNLLDGRDVLSKNEYLNFRKQIDHMIGWDSAASSDGKGLVKLLRGAVNEKAHFDYPELKALDNKFSVEKKYLNQIKRDFFDKDYNLTDQAEGKIYSLLTPNNRKKLERVEKLVPGITKDLRAIRALADVEFAKGHKVGAYTASLLTAGAGAVLMGAGAGVILPTLALAVISSPYVAVPLIVKYALNKPHLRHSMQNIVTKIKQGVRLTPTESKSVSEIIQEESTKIQMASKKKRLQLMDEMDTALPA